MRQAHHCCSHFLFIGGQAMLPMREAVEAGNMNAAQALFLSYGLLKLWCCDAPLFQSNKFFS